jgi:hypothetical protein
MEMVVLAIPEHYAASAVLGNQAFRPRIANSKITLVAVGRLGRWGGPIESSVVVSQQGKFAVTKPVLTFNAFETF